MLDKYHQGDTLRLQCSFTVSDTLTDPSTITLKTLDPAGTTSTYTYALAEVTKSGTGVYYKDVNFDKEGTWYWKWIGTGTVAAVDEGKVNIVYGPL